MNTSYGESRNGHYRKDNKRLARRSACQSKAVTFHDAQIDFPIGGFSPPEGRLARGFKPPAFSRFLFQSAVKSAESF